MINDAAARKQEDAALLEKVTAKKSLENSAFSIRNALNKPQIKDLMQKSDRKAVEDAKPAAGSTATITVSRRSTKSRKTSSRPSMSLSPPSNLAWLAAVLVVSLSRQVRNACVRSGK